jgi:2-polyprenyl-3-methyl-5-hydroxy-6-metoxy-1,4-benzoquinol methylase
LAQDRLPQASTTLPRVDAEELRKRVDAFPSWNYRFELAGGVATPVGDKRLVNRQHQRYRYFFQRLLGASGGSLQDRRVLDLGCNAGYWALAAIEAGADFVLGIDLSSRYIEQARLVFEANGIDPARYRLQAGDLFSADLGGAFDVVLCLGVLDHVDRPVELFELIARTGAELIVIDSEVSRARTSLFEVSRLYSARDVTGDGTVLIPSRQAVIDLAGRVGYDAVALASNVTDFTGMSDYRRERRCAFVCSRQPLSGLPVERRPRLIPWWARDPRALSGV